MNRKRIVSLIVLMLLASAILLDLDLLAIYSPLGRLAIFDLVVLGSLLFLFTKVRIYRGFKELNTFTLLVILFSLYMLISGIYIINIDSRTDFNAVISTAGKFMLYALVTFQITNEIIKYNLNNNFLRILINLNYLVIIIGVFQILAVSRVPFFSDVFLWDNIRGGGHRIAATFRWQGVLVFYLSIILPLLIALVIDKKQNLKMGYLSIALLIIIGFYSGSRSFLLVLIPSLSIPIMKPFIVNNFRVPISRIVLILVATSGFLYIFMDKILESRAVMRIFGLDGAVGLTTSGPEPRERIAIAGYQEWLQQPITGVGSGNLEKIIGQAAHNSYLEILFENGLIGTVFFVIISIVLTYMIFYLTFKSFQENSIYYYALGIVIINIALYQLTASAVQYRLLWIIFPLIFAEFYKLKYRSKSKLKKI